MIEKDAVMAPTPHTEGARALVEKLRALKAEIPRFVPEGPGEAKALATKASLNEQFLEAASVSVQRSSALEAGTGTNPETLRDAVAFALAYEAVLTEATGFRRAVAHVIRVAKASAGKSALDIYAIAQRLAQNKDGADLVPHVQDMRRKLKRGRRKATSEPAPDPVVKPAPNK